MTEKYIKDNAPCDATHYDDSCGDVVYYKKNNENICEVWNDCDDPFDPWWDVCLWDFQESTIKPL